MVYSNLNTSLIPSLEIWTALVAGFSVMIFLFIFSHPPLKLPLVLKRYSASIGGGLLVWFLLLWANNGFVDLGVEQWLALIAGGLIYLTAVFCNYYLGNIGGGFRIEMLVNLAEAKREITLDEWMALYGKGMGMRYFLEDRLLATLVPWKLASWETDHITLTPRGHFAGRVNRFLSTLFSEELGDQ